jgi:Zn-dependent metalloprotease
MFAHRRHFRSLSILFIFTLLLSGFRLPSAFARQGPGGIEHKINAQTGKVSFIGPEKGQILSAADALGADSAARPSDPAMALAKRFGSEFGLKDPERDLKEMKSDHSGDGRITIHYQQNYQGIPVLGGELIVNTNQNGDLYSINGEVSPALALSIEPAISADQATNTALQAAAKWYQKAPKDFVVSEPELWVYDESLLRPSTRPAELVWRMEITPQNASMPVRELVLVNAYKGGISLHFNQLDTAWKAPEHAQLKQPLTALSSTDLERHEKDITSDLHANQNEYSSRVNLVCRDHRQRFQFLRRTYGSV